MDKKIRVGRKTCEFTLNDNNQFSIIFDCRTSYSKENKKLTNIYISEIKGTLIDDIYLRQLPNVQKCLCLFFIFILSSSIESK